ncbi:hypothetical protein BS78_K043200 [Paspalum vaginatum]|uniref:Uncharacterized protein n=1 Tax=Paspalum vaginatum TaxID=158149 RepID=A0A9W7X751_9POAL|nr:hypothetical protein BS78_K043200 [Paspalum vaginatum]
MNNLSDKMKDDAKKILSSKHLFYEEMCSYHNKNRLNLPEDNALQHSLLLALRCKEEHEPRREAGGDANDDQSDDSDYEDDDEEHPPLHTDMREPTAHKRARHGDVGFVTSSCHEGSGRSDPHGITVDINKVFPDGTNLASQALEIQKRRLLIEENGLEITKQRLKWERFRKKKDREIERMALENEHMMLENKRLELELRHKELDLELTLKGQGNHA